MLLLHDLGDGVHLRLFEERDADELHELIVANREHLAPWMPWAQQSAEDTRTFIRGTRQAVADDAGLVTAMVVDGRIAGSVGTHRVDRQHGKASLGYWIGAAYQGRGIVTRAVAAYVDHVFDHWRLRRIEIECAVDNARSRAVAERLGFTCEGVMREAYVVGDKAQDIALYALLRREWDGER